MYTPKYRTQIERRSTFKRAQQPFFCFGQPPQSRERLASEHRQARDASLRLRSEVLGVRVEPVNQLQGGLVITLRKCEFGTRRPALPLAESLPRETGRQRFGQHLPGAGVIVLDDAAYGEST